MVIRNTVRGIAFWKCSTAFKTETEPLLQKDANKQKTQLNQPFLVVIKVKYSCPLYQEKQQPVLWRKTSKTWIKIKFAGPAKTTIVFSLFNFYSWQCFPFSFHFLTLSIEIEKMALKKSMVLSMVEHFLAPTRRKWWHRTYSNRYRKLPSKNVWTSSISLELGSIV